MSSSDLAEPYQVLARRRRPQDFGALIGQEAMVRVLRNAFATGRIAHAFVLTGVRGVGKTTTARIIARGLNCEGPDGARAEPTIDPCGVCEPCRAIAEGRFIDVMEIDAASHTGVDFIRDLNEMARTRPTARYKVFILDEVHMLSTQAFNALLKTLEEPPGHVKFVFATTEIHKVPTTILSRCQRFDLRRIEPERMLAFLAEVAEAEKVGIAPEALGLVTRAAEGSVRDALSLLDQAIAHAGPGEAVTAERTRAMLGLADRARAIDLFERVMRGEAREALGLLREMHRDGADPAAVLGELAEIAHWVTVVKVDPAAADDPTVTPAEREGGLALAKSLEMRQLSRAWQMLLKALEETARAPRPLAAAEMALIRLTHVAELPTPEEIVRRLSGDAQPPSGGGPGGGARTPGGPPGGGAGTGSAGTGSARAEAAPAARPTLAHGGGGGGAAAAAASAASAAPRAVAAAPSPERRADAALAAYADFDAVLGLIRGKRDMAFAVTVERFVRIVSYAPGRIAFEPGPGAPADLAGELTRKLHGWTGARWIVTVVSEGGAPSAHERRRAEEAALLAQAEDRPLVRAALAAFPGARVTGVRPLKPPPPPSDLEPPPAEPEDGEWAPIDAFDEE